MIENLYTTVYTYIMVYLTRGLTLTSRCIVYVHRIPMAMVPKVPTTYPAFLNALGMAKIPVPRLAFRKCISVSKYLLTTFGIIITVPRYRSDPYR